jgi:hypothetical protein
MMRLEMCEIKEISKTDKVYEVYEIYEEGDYEGCWICPSYKIAQKFFSSCIEGSADIVQSHVTLSAEELEMYEDKECFYSH